MNGEGPAPLALWLSRICDEFHCLPSEAYREWLTTPCGVIEDVLEAKGYASAKDLFDHAKSRKDLPDHPMIDLVAETDLDLAAEELERRKKKPDGE